MSKIITTSESQEKDLSNSNYLIEYIEVENTPFTLVVEEKGVRIAIGNQICCEKTFDNIGLARHYIDFKPWDLIITATAIINELKTKLK